MSTKELNERSSHMNEKVERSESMKSRKIFEGNKIMKDLKKWKRWGNCGIVTKRIEWTKKANERGWNNGESWEHERAK